MASNGAADTILGLFGYGIGFAVLAIATAAGAASHASDAEEAARAKASSSVQAHARACGPAAADPAGRAAQASAYGWPLSDRATDAQAAAILGLTPGEAAALRSPLSLDCPEPGAPPRAVLFTRQPEGGWRIQAYG